MKVLKPLVNRKNAPWPVYHFSGIAFLQKKEYGTALSFLLESVRQGADEPETHHSISICYFNLGSYEEAEEHANIALEKKPEFFKGWLHLGSIYRAQAKLEDALKCYQKANALDQKSASVAYRIAEIYNDQGDLNKALELYEITVKVDPEYYEAYLAKSQVLRKQRKYDEAEECIYKVLKDDPKHLAARVELGEHFKYAGNYEKAIELYEKMIQEFPKVGGIRVNYALCLQELGRFDESEKHYMIAFKDQPESFESLSNYLMGVHYNPERTKEEIFEAHKLWDQHFSPAEKPKRPVPFNCSKDKKIRLGLISGGFRTHPVGWMITKALENLPSDQFEVYCYTTNNSYDKITRRIHEATDKWQSVIGYNDQVIAGMIREDEIDILVELSGHSADTRLKTVALEPAPVIVKWVGGLFNTTGLKSVDYLLTDHYETPEGEEKYYTEKLIRMPDDYISFLPPDYAPEVCELPSLKNGYVTFGCFNNPTKVNDEILVKWAQIMNCVPESRLFLKSKQYDTEALRERIINTMKENGISEDRLRFEGLSPHDELLDKYNEVDIALDPWPYSGGLTTCEALWMGVPVITKPGPTFAGRHSTTHLINAGLPELVADTWEEYIEKTVELAADLEQLAELRAGLRSQVEGSPLADGPRFGAHFAKAMRAAWHQWADGFEDNSENWANHIDVDAVDDQHIERTVQPTKPSDDMQGMLDNIEQEINGSAINDSMHAVDKTPVNGSLNGVHENGSVRANGSENSSVANEKKPDEYKIETTDGVTICTPADLEMMTPYVLLEQKQWYENELDFVRDFLKAGMSVVDIGAGFGVYALPAAKLVGESGKVFAFEPGPVTKHHLEMSKLENGFKNLEVIGKAVSAKNGKHAWKTADTPEQNRLDETVEGEVQTIKLDSWWHFEGEPKLDVLKIDVNGAEAGVLKGASEVLQQESPVLLISITDQRSNAFVSELKEHGYALYEYIPGPGILAEHDIEAGADPYMQNLIAVPDTRTEEFRKAGWLHDESVQLIDVEQDLWKTELGKLPWTHELMEQWENHGNSEGIVSYLQALNYLIAAEQIDVTDSGIDQSRSQKAGLLLNAAQILIGLYNQGANSSSVVFTLVRSLNTLGKRSQAVEVMQKLIENTKLGQENMNVDLPFMLPIPEQDKASIKTDLSKWLMVRTVEAWILLKDWTTYLSGEQEQKLLEVLEGNVEVSDTFDRSIQMHHYLKDEEKDFVLIRDFFSSNPIYPVTSKEITFSPDRSDYFKTMVKMILEKGAVGSSSHSLPGELVVSLTSYPDRFNHLPLTLLSLIKQSVSPDKIILWIAEKDRNALTKDILQFEDCGVAIRFCEDLKSYKKIIPTLENYPEAFIITADDDLYYNKRWIQGLVQDYESNECVVAHRVHRIRFDNTEQLRPYKEWGWQYRESFKPSELNFPTSGAGTLYPPGIFHKDVTNTELFQRLSPTADDVWLYFMVKMNGGKFKVSRYEHKLIEWKQENQNTLWKENLINGKNDEQIQRIIEKYGVPIKTSSEPVFTVRSNAGNYKMLLPQWKNDHIQRIIANSGRPYEEKMLFDMKGRVKEGDLILDIGANIGNHSLFMASIGKCKVISFEPNKQLAESLRRSIEINKLSNNIQLVQKGVGRKKSFANFKDNISFNLGAQSLSITDDNDGAIEVITLDSIEIHDNIILIKIDVEGMELDVLKGAKNTLIEHKPVLYLEAGKKEDFLLLNEFLVEMGYKYQATFNATPTHLFINKA